MRRALRCLLLVHNDAHCPRRRRLNYGANGGIGAELVVQFARAGYDVVAACRSRSAHVHQLVSKASVANKVKVLLGLDVTSPDKVDAFVDGLKRQRTAGYPGPRRGRRDPATVFISLPGHDGADDPWIVGLWPRS